MVSSLLIVTLSECYFLVAGEFEHQQGEGDSSQAVSLACSRIADYAQMAMSAQVLTRFESDDALLPPNMWSRGRFSEGMADGDQQPPMAFALLKTLPEPLGFQVALLHQLPEVRRQGGPIRAMGQIGAAHGGPWVQQS